MQEAKFGLKGLRRRDRVVPAPVTPLAVLGVQRRQPRSAGRVLRRQARDLVPLAVGVEQVAIHVDLKNTDRRELGQGVKQVLTVTQLAIGVVQLFEFALQLLNEPDIVFLDILQFLVQLGRREDGRWRCRLVQSTRESFAGRWPHQRV